MIHKYEKSLPDGHLVRIPHGAVKGYRRYRIDQRDSRVGKMHLTLFIKILHKYCNEKFLLEQFLFHQ